MHDCRCCRMFRGFFICTTVVVVCLARAALAGHGSEEPVAVVSMERVKYYLTAREPMILVDLRPAKEFQQSHIPGARSLPMAELEKRMNEVPKAGRVILYCDCPQDELIREAYVSLRDDYDYRNIAIMGDTFKEWLKKKYPTEKSRK
jgi:rhodanese-related sulfurtransferase